MVNHRKKSIGAGSAPPSPGDTLNVGNIAQRLRQVRHASRDFLVLWAYEQLAGDSQAMKRIAGDVAQIPGASADAALADPYDHNWSILYRGSVLDD
jgi:hypothetical protein